MRFISLEASKRAGKKWAVTLEDAGRRVTVHFGAAGMSDYTQHRDPERQRRYIARHAPRERWGEDGVRTPGFWSRWLLWGPSTSLQGNLQAVRERFKL